MKLYNVGILGATGAVGQEMMKILLERKFPVGELRPIASARSAGSEIDFGGRKRTIVEASDDAFEGLDIVLGAAENDIAERFAPAIVKAGAVFVDNSSAFRLDPKVPLVIPEINPEDVKWLHEHMQEFAANDAKALCEYFGIPFKDPYAAAQPPKEEKPTETKVLYAVQVGAYANRENAEKMAEKLKEKGFAAYITKK